MRVYITYSETYPSSKQYRVFKSSDVYNYYLISNLSSYDLIIIIDDFRRIDRKIIRF